MPFRHFVCGAGVHRLSGGQMRRVSIGTELVACPAILFLDEPTSGLDASNSRLVVAALKALCASGVLTIAALHQPRYAAYELTSKLLILNRGELVYGGPREGALRYFARLGFGLPEHANPADFFIEVTFGHIQSVASPPVGCDDLPAKWRRSAHEVNGEAREGPPTDERGAISLAAFLGWFGAAGVGQGVPAGGVCMAPELCERVHAAATATTSGAETPTWPQLLAAIGGCELPASAQPGPSSQLLLCASRYLRKRSRTRRRYYATCAVVALGGLMCGFTIGTHARMWDIILTYTVTNAIFATVVSSAAIATFGDAREQELLCHEVRVGTGVADVADAAV